MLLTFWTQIGNLVKFNEMIFYVLDMSIWKCYRCNLLFKELSHANLHNDITKHSTEEIIIPGIKFTNKS